MEEIIKLNSISNHDNYLKQLTKKDGTKSDTYMLVTDVPASELRLSKDLSTIKWLDAPGGPRITVGKSIKGTDSEKVKYIDYIKNRGYIITFENGLSSN